MHEDALAVWFEGAAPSLLELILILTFAVVAIDLALAAFGVASEHKVHPGGPRSEAP
jgi:hypothetical protein